MALTKAATSSSGASRRRAPAASTHITSLIGPRGDDAQRPTANRSPEAKPTEVIVPSTTSRPPGGLADRCPRPRPVRSAQRSRFPFLLELLLERRKLLVVVALDVDLGQQPVEPAGNPPVAVTQQLHRGRHEDHADQRGVEQHGEGQAEAEQLDLPV